MFRGLGVLGLRFRVLGVQGLGLWGNRNDLRFIRKHASSLHLRPRSPEFEGLSLNLPFFSFRV